jgi:hypothetical protein
MLFQQHCSLVSEQPPGLTDEGEEDEEYKDTVAYSNVQQTLLSTESYSISFIKTDNGKTAGLRNVSF